MDPVIQASLPKMIEEHAAYEKCALRGKQFNVTGLDLTGVNLEGVSLNGASFNRTRLAGAILTRAHLRCSGFHEADLRGTHAHHADLAGAGLVRADLSDAVLSNADLRDADLRGANLTGTFLCRVGLTGTDLSGVTGLLDPVEYLAQNFEQTQDGIIVYKVQWTGYKDDRRPPSWAFAPGAILSEVVNPDPCIDCACGVNVGTLAWIKSEWRADWQVRGIWKCLIPWKWAAGIVVPYATNGKIRASRVQLLEPVGSS